MPVDLAGAPVLALITDHPWRPFHNWRGADGVFRSGWELPAPCAFMNCRRPPSEHARTVTGCPGKRGRKPQK